MENNPEQHEQIVQLLNDLIKNISQLNLNVIALTKEVRSKQGGDK